MAHKAYPCIADGNGLRPIHLASRQGKPHMVNYLIDLGMEIIPKFNEKGILVSFKL